MLFPTSIYPKAHNPISVDWVGPGGGIRVYAYTSDKCEPILAIAGFDHLRRLTLLSGFYRLSWLKKEALCNRMGTVQ